MVSINVFCSVRKTVTVKDVDVVLWSKLKQEAKRFKVSAYVLLNSLLDEKLEGVVLDKKLEGVVLDVDADECKSMEVD